MRAAGTKSEAKSDFCCLSEARLQEEVRDIYGRDENDENHRAHQHHIMGRTSPTRELLQGLDGDGTI